jgi:Xaa-Pro aminopeptidase
VVLIFAAMRAKKSPMELVLQHAIDISTEAHDALIAAATAKWEYEIDAEVAHIQTSQRRQLGIP